MIIIFFVSIFVVFINAKTINDKNRERKNYTYNLNESHLINNESTYSPFIDSYRDSTQNLIKIYTPKFKTKNIVRAYSNKLDSTEANLSKSKYIEASTNYINNLNPLGIIIYMHQLISEVFYSPIQILSYINASDVEFLIQATITAFEDENLVSESFLYNSLYKNYLNKNIQNSKDKESKGNYKNIQNLKANNVTKNNINNSWELYIPKFKDTIYINEGISPDILNNGSGHFEDTAKENGNVCLAGHNRGYKVNAFKNLKDLNVGSKLIYKYGKNTYKYSVTKKEIIDETDFRNIDREGDYLTLITCINNNPSKRLCITAEK